MIIPQAADESRVVQKRKHSIKTRSGGDDDGDDSDNVDSTKDMTEYCTEVKDNDIKTGDSTNVPSTDKDVTKRSDRT
ncbi:hypothetical protein BGX21_006544 [Mortierella sp. AD011]|nr:hypothetical protein BGX20_007251 [Mortierella sp. AD010]KAF9403178.1 hypothetical protein BGX21_006544 [Mortierella sp. AD011]